MDTLGGDIYATTAPVLAVDDLSLIGTWINENDASKSIAFEIGTGGTFIVPEGAKVLYPGSMDGHRWNNKRSQFRLSR